MTRSQRARVRAKATRSNIMIETQKNQSEIDPFIPSAELADLIPKLQKLFLLEEDDGRIVSFSEERQKVPKTKSIQDWFSNTMKNTCLEARLEIQDGEEGNFIDTLKTLLIIRLNLRKEETTEYINDREIFLANLLEELDEWSVKYPKTAKAWGI